MTSATTGTAQLIRQVVRGERPWTDLQPLGMKARPAEGRCEFPPTFPSEARIDLLDVARGLHTHLHDVGKLREWAFVVEALPAEFDMEGHPSGEAVMGAVWSASFGDPLTEDQVSLIETLARDDEKRS